MAQAPTPASRLDGSAQSPRQGPSRVCLDCGGDYASGRPHAEFCSDACRKAWNNRRAVRGAELYDLYMALRFDRAAATHLHVWRIACRLVSAWRDEDRTQRAGRRSWRHPAEILARRPYLAATTVARNIAGRRRK